MKDKSYVEISKELNKAIKELNKAFFEAVEPFIKPIVIWLDKIGKRGGL
jgi:hypothetical protein